MIGPCWRGLGLACALAVAVDASAASPVWEIDLSASSGGLYDGGGTGQWAWSDPADGPVGGGACWGTNPDGNYLNDTTDWLAIPLPSLAIVDQPTLVLTHWYAVREGDTAIVEIDDGTGENFVRLDPSYGTPHTDGFVGQSGGYVDAVFDLRGHGDATIARLSLASNLLQADAGWYLQRVMLWDGDITAPRIEPVGALADTQDLQGPYAVDADIVDDHQVTNAILWVDVDGEVSSMAMTRSLGARWSAAIAARDPDTTVRYWIEATDGENLARWPASGTSDFRVFLAAPTDLTGPLDAHAVATDVELSWSPPDTEHEVLAYHVFREGVTEPIAQVPTPEATVEVAEPQQYRVAAMYEAGLGNPSEVLGLSVELPELLSIEPTTAFQGDEIYLHLSGTSLYLFAGDSQLTLGPDTNVVDFDVRDAHAAVARVRISPLAETGTRAVILEGTSGRFAFPDRFAVLEGSDAPRILSVTPEVAGQGDEVRVEIEASLPFADAPTIIVDDGRDLVLTSDVAWDGPIASFDLAVSSRSRIGLHSLAIDDGVRLFTATVRVEETVDRLDSGCQGCSSRPGGSSGAWPFGAGVLCGLSWLRRRAPGVERHLIAPLPAVE